MDYRRTLKTAGEAIHTMRQFLSEEELKLMDAKAEGYKKLHERTMAEPFDKFIIDRILGFEFKWVHANLLLINNIKFFAIFYLLFESTKKYFKPYLKICRYCLESMTGTKRMRASKKF